MRKALVVVLIAFSLLWAGCGSPPSDDPSVAAPSSGGMGMGGAPGSGGDPMTGVVAASNETALELGSAGVSARGLLISRVLAPADGWLVARSTASPGGVLGMARVSKGENRGVRIKLTAVDGMDVRVALHVDAGSHGVFEFDPLRVSRSPDRQVFVDGAAVQRDLKLTGFGVPVEPHSATMVVRNQPAKGDALTLEYLLLPSPSWVSVRLLESGLPGRQLGLARVGRGEFQQYRVPLKASVKGEEVVVTLIADRGQEGKFEQREADPLNSADQPYISAGILASQRARIE